MIDPKKAADIQVVDNMKTMRREWYVMDNGQRKVIAWLDLGQPSFVQAEGILLRKLLK